MARFDYRPGRCRVKTFGKFPCIIIIIITLFNDLGNCTRQLTLRDRGKGGGWDGEGRVGNKREGGEGEKGSGGWENLRDGGDGMSYAHIWSHFPSRYINTLC